MKFLDYLGTVLPSQVSRENLLSLRFLQDIRDGLSSSYKGFHLFWEDGPAWYALAVAVFLFVTMFVQQYDAKMMLILSIVFGYFAGLDNHLGNHFASMRICTFYPVFLAGFYSNPNRFLEREKDGGILRRTLVKIGSAALLCITLGISLRHSETLYSHINLLKGKTNYITLGFGAYGVLWRLVTYFLWLVLIFAIIELCPRKKFFWSWFGERTMSIFIWHKFLLVIVMQLFFGKYFIKYYMPHYYILAAICIAAMIFIVSAYLPELRIANKLKRKNETQSKK